MDESLDFTDDEIREELSKLGYSHVPDSRLDEFKQDLARLIHHEKSKLSSQNTSLSSHGYIDSSISGHRAAVRERTPLEESSLEGRRSPLEFRPISQRGGKENHPMRAEPVIKKPVAVGPRRTNDHISMYDSETTGPSHSLLRDDVSETDSERRMVKRKVLRKDKDGSRRIDESVTESDTGSLMDINERLRQLGIADSVEFFDRRPQSARTEPPYRLSPEDPRPASVILRKPEHPHSKNLRKSDPVARYQQFRQSWSQQRAPGEKTHKHLRWNVREQMLQQDVVYEKKPQKVYVPNSYIIPSDKKRNSLRWQMRMDMAMGQMPQHGFYHEFH